MAGYIIEKNNVSQLPIKSEGFITCSFYMSNAGGPMASSVPCIYSKNWINGVISLTYVFKITAAMGREYGKLLTDLKTPATSLLVNLFWPEHLLWPHRR